MENTESYKYKIASLEKAFSIINLLAENNTKMSMVEISRKLKLQSGTLHRFLSTLKDLGYIEQDKNTKKYYLTFSFYKITNSIEKATLQNLYPYLRILLNKYPFSINISGFSNDEVIFLKNLYHSVPVNILPDIGDVISLHNTAAGKIYLSTLSEKALNETADKIIYFPSAAKTILNKAALLKDIMVVRENGYSTSIDEFTQGFAILGFPLKNLQNKTVACVAFVTSTQNSDLLLDPNTISDIRNTIGHIYIDQE